MTESQGHHARVLAARQNNIEVSRARLQDSYSLADDVDDAYDALARLIREAPALNRDISIAGGLFLACQHELTKAVLEVLAGYLTDAMAPTRRAVELAAFAALIIREPELRKTYMLSGGEENAYEIYRKVFKTKRAFPKADDHLQELFQRYDYCSRQLHASVYSLAGRLTFEMEGNVGTAVWNMFEVSEQDPSEPARAFLFVIAAHIGILKLFAREFRQFLESGWMGWEVRITSLEAKTAAHRVRWGPVMEAASAKMAARVAQMKPNGDSTPTRSS